MIRRRAVKEVASVGGSDAVLLLAPLLRDDTQEVREQAAIALGTLRDDRGIEPLAAALDVGTTPRDTSPIIKALGAIGGARAAEVLANRLTQGEGLEGEGLG
jgi:HEAT repeat protein